MNETRSRNDRPLRVAVVVPGYEEGGGVPALADFVCAALARSGEYETRLISLAVRWNDPLSTQMTRPGTWLRQPATETVTIRERSDVMRVGARWAEPEIMRYWPRSTLDRAVAHADLVHVICGSAVWANALRRTQKPLIIQPASTLRHEREPNGTAFHGNPLRRITTRLSEPLERAALRRADGVFAINAWLRDDLSRTIDPQRIHFVPPGVDTTIFHADPTVARDRLLYVGRLGDPRKNVRMLLAAYAKIRATQPSAPPLILAGSGALSRADARFLAASGLGRDVEILASPDRQTLAVLYQRCLALLLASHEEGLGIVLMEAMAAGAPVVATDCGGPRTILSDGREGFLVPVGGADAMAACILRLLDDDVLRTDMGRAARARIEAEFSIARCEERLMNVYRLVAAEVARKS